MNKMFAFEELELMQQNLSSVENGEGIFILDRNGDIIFANRKARDVYIWKEEIKRKLDRRKIILNKRNKKVVIYPILEKNDIRFFFGLVRNDEEIDKMKHKIMVIQKRFDSFKENMSHYFFNPIVIAKGYLDILLEKRELSNEDKEDVKKVKEAIERIEKVVRNIVVEGIIKE